MSNWESAGLSLSWSLILGEERWLSGPGVGAHQTDDCSGHVELTYLQHLWQKSISLPNSPVTHFLEDFGCSRKRRPVAERRPILVHCFSSVLGRQGVSGPGGSSPDISFFQQFCKILNKSCFISPPTPSTHFERLPQNWPIEWSLGCTLALEWRPIRGDEGFKGPKVLWFLAKRNKCLGPEGSSPDGWASWRFSISAKSWSKKTHFPTHKSPHWLTWKCHSAWKWSFGRNLALEWRPILGDEGFDSPWFF